MAKFCSQKCYGISLKKNVGGLNPFFGKTHTESVRERISDARKGRRYAVFTEFKKGVRPWNYRGGVDVRSYHSLFSPEYVLWRKSVFVRDSFKCRISNGDCSGQLEVHHILRWADYPELRYQLNNGITLCHFHHPRRKEEEKRLQSEFQALVSVSSD